MTRKPTFRMGGLTVAVVATLAASTLEAAPRTTFRAKARTGAASQTARGRINQGQVVVGGLGSVLVPSRGPTINGRKPSVKVNKRKTIAHKPFTNMVDPRTGEAVSKDTLLTLFNGRKMKAGEYYTRLNALEKKLNAQGHSLHDRQRIRLASLPVDRNVLRRQLAAAGKATVVDNRTRGRSGGAPTTFKFEAVTTVPAPGGTFEELAPETDGRVTERRVRKTFDKTYGVAGVMDAYLRGELELVGNRQGVSMHGKASAGGTLLGANVNVMTASADVEAKTAGASTGRIKLSGLGFDDFEIAKSGNLNEKGAKKRQLDWNVKIPVFSVAGISVNLRFGAIGTASINYQMAVTSNPSTDRWEVSSNFAPDVKAEVFAGVSVDLLIGGASVEGRLTLVQAKMDVRGGLVLILDESNPRVAEFVTSNYGVKLLGGKLVVVAYVEACLKYVGCVRKSWDLYTIWENEGLTVSDEIFSSLKTTKLK